MFNLNNIKTFVYDIFNNYRTNINYNILNSIIKCISTIEINVTKISNNDTKSISEINNCINIISNNYYYIETYIDSISNEDAVKGLLKAFYKLKEQVIQELNKKLW